MIPTPIRRWTTAAVTAAALAGLAITTATDAQSTRGRQNDTSTARETYTDTYVFDLDFPGGTLREYVSAIQQKAATTNVLIDPAAEQIPVPAVQFRSVDVATAMELLDHRTADVDGHIVRVDVRTIDPPNSLSEPVYAVHAGAVSGRQFRNRMNNVMSVKDLLNADYTADDILTAIETTLDLINDGAQAEVRFHEETGLLITRGPEEKVTTIVKVVAQLREAAMQQESRQQEELDQHRRHREMMALQEKFEEVQHQRQIALEQLTEARTRAELLRRELENARARLNERDHETVELQSRIRALQMEVHELRQELNKRQGNP